MLDICMWQRWMMFGMSQFSTDKDLTVYLLAYTETLVIPSVKSDAFISAENVINEKFRTILKMKNIKVCIYKFPRLFIKWPQQQITTTGLKIRNCIWIASNLCFERRIWMLFGHDMSFPHFFNAFSPPDESPQSKMMASTTANVHSRG